MPDTADACPFAAVTIDHVVIRAQDMQQMLHFYSNVLGCKLERELTNLGLKQLRAGSSLIDLVDVNGPLVDETAVDDKRSDQKIAGRNMDHFCIQIQPWEPEQIFAHLRRHNVTTGQVEQRYGALGTGPSIYIEDPEHNVVELKGPPA